jgi:hypothetical protein
MIHQQRWRFRKFWSKPNGEPFNDSHLVMVLCKVGLVETVFGFHIIKITDKQDGIRLATVAQKKKLQKQLLIKFYASKLRNGCCR